MLRTTKNDNKCFKELLYLWNQSQRYASLYWKGNIFSLVVAMMRTALEKNAGFTFCF